MLERLGSTVFILLVCFLVFSGGVLLAVTETPPYHFYRDAYRAADALWEQRLTVADRYRTDLWREARRSERGVTRLEAERVRPGYTLYTSGDGGQARLISLEGELLHEWTLPFSSIWEEGRAAVANPQPDELVFMRKARLLPDGDLLAIYEAAGDSPYGYGMVRMDRESNPVWTYLEHTHHDFDLAPDGRIFALTHAFVWEGPPALQHLDRPFLDDFVVVLSPEGEELAKVSLVEAVERSRFEAFIYAIPHFSSGDPLHTNTVGYIDAETARAFPHGEEGQVILSFRDIGVIAVLDIEREEIVWAARGSWMGQHHPSLLPNGDILIFDNLGGFRRGNASRILQVDPETLGIVWRYEGTEAEPFDSPLRAEAFRLDNGNTLITESDGGRLFEVDPEGRIVWEYLNPVRGGENDAFIPVVAWAQRIDPGDLDADFRALLE